MKKSLIALAALAVTGAAFAQSSVTLSGTVDVGVEKRWSGDAYKMTSNRSGTSAWTLSGTEDLGGGLKAVFQVSTAFDASTGETTAANALGNNGMFLGLTGDFGTLRAGRPAHVLYANAMYANGTKGVSAHDANSVVSGNTTATLKTGGSASSVYSANALQYLSPRFGGVQVQLEWAPSEQAVPATAAVKNDGFGIAVRFDSGPLSASLVNFKAASNATSIAKNKAVTQVAAGYDFGVAKAVFTFRDQDGLASDMDTSYALGVTAPVGPGSLYASYNVSEQVGDDGRTIIAGYKYSLSKRTTAYVNLANRNKTWANSAVVASGGKANSSSTGFGAGLQHNF